MSYMWIYIFFFKWFGPFNFYFGLHIWYLPNCPFPSFGFLLELGKCWRFRKQDAMKMLRLGEILMIKRESWWRFWRLMKILGLLKCWRFTKTAGVSGNPDVFWRKPRRFKIWWCFRNWWSSNKVQAFEKSAGVWAQIILERTDPNTNFGNLRGLQIIALLKKYPKLGKCLGWKVPICGGNLKKDLVIFM